MPRQAMAMGYVGGLDTLLAILAAWYSLTQQVCARMSAWRRLIVCAHAQITFV